MFLTSLSLAGFKNYTGADLRFCPGVNCFSGRNGSGKTNILDAIHYLCFTRSWFNINDSQNIQLGAEWMRIQGQFNRDEAEEQVSIQLKRNAKKVVKYNGKEYDRLSDHIGRYPMVMIVPADINIIYARSEDRRRMLDMAISQVDRHYLVDLMEYNRALEQRNRQLKHFGEGQPFSRDLLAIWEKTMLACGARIYATRQAYLKQILDLFTVLYKELSQGNDSVSLQYESQLGRGDFAQQMEELLGKDLALQRSNVGIHKDDVLFLLDGQPLKRFGSQGQQKSFIIALKLAEYQFLKKSLACMPLLLLDDIFEKIDEHRARALLQMISAGSFGQIFITDTSMERLRQVFSAQSVEVNFFAIENGKAVTLDS